MGREGGNVSGVWLAGKIAGKVSLQESTKLYSYMSVITGLGVSMKMCSI